MNTKFNITILYTNEFRYSEGGCLEQKCTEIQHKQSEMREVGIYSNIWKPVTVNLSEDKIYFSC